MTSRTKEEKEVPQINDKKMANNGGGGSARKK